MSGVFGDGIPIPDVIDPPESMSMTLCIPKNRDHMSAFFGALYQLTIWNSWQQNGTTDGKELAAVWWRYYLSWNRAMSDIDCEDGNMDCCTEPAIIKRINPDTGNIEQSTNGGATWSPVAGGIQSYIVQPVPPVTSGVAATKCDAATNLSGQIDIWIDQVSIDFETAGNLVEFGVAVFLAIMGAVLIVLSAGALTPLQALIIPTLGAALAAAWGAGKSVFDAYWTVEIKDAILCAAYCNIGDDGSFSPVQFSAFWSEINANLPPSPAKMLLMGFLSSVGQAGVNAMAASGMAADADCSDCPCAPCTSKWSIFTDDPSHAHGQIIAVTDDYIDVQSGAVLGNGNAYIIIRTANKDTCCCMIDREVLVGTITQAGNASWTTCGVEPVEGVPQFSFGLLGGETPVNYIQMQSATTFTVRIYLIGC